MAKEVFVLCAFLCVIFEVNAEDDEKCWGSLTKNGIFYNIFNDHYFSIYGNISILRQGGVSDIDQMYSLQLFKTGIKRIEPGALKNLPNLVFFDILGGHLNEIGAGIFNNLNLTELELKDCHLEIIAPHSFDGMTNLQKVRFDGNQLKQWDPNWFAKTPSMRNIYMDSNEIEEIPANVVKNLKEIDVLFLYDNRISRIDDSAFNGVKRIGVLQLSNNNLENFNATILRGIEIDELRLSNNKIHCLPEEELSKLFIAEVTHLEENPWDPECLKKIKKWVQDHRVNVLF